MPQEERNYTWEYADTNPLLHNDACNIYLE